MQRPSSNADALLKVVLLTAHLSDAAGGFSRAIPGLANALERFGAETHVVGIRDCHSPEAWRQWGTNVQAHRQIGPRAFGWTPGLPAALQRLSPDIVDAQGLWMYPSIVSLGHQRRGGRSYMITPHGMLDPWTLRRSAWKKRLVAAWFENEHLRRAACLRALNQDEAKAFRAYGLSNPIAIVPNGVDLPCRIVPEAGRSRTILFLGRIDVKKGISELLHAWRLATADPVCAGWHLQITGWGDPGYVAAMQRLATSLGIETSVTFTGPLFGAKKAAAFGGAAAFVLPSFSEGLPMAVLEAWSYGLPVLMTRECNLPEGFAAGAAMRIDSDPGAMAKSLLGLMETPPFERRAMGKAGRRLVEERFTWDRVAIQMHEVYTWVIGGGSRPHHVMTE